MDSFPELWPAYMIGMQVVALVQTRPKATRTEKCCEGGNRAWEWHPLCELCVDDIWVLVPIVDTDPHLYTVSIIHKLVSEDTDLSKCAQSC